MWLLFSILDHFTKGNIEQWPLGRKEKRKEKPLASNNQPSNTMTGDFLLAGKIAWLENVYANYK